MATMSTLAILQTATTTWNLDPTHSLAEFKVKHMMIFNVDGQFATVTGVLTLDETDRTNSSGSGELTVAGDLTIRGVARNAIFTVQGPTPPARAPWGSTRLGLSATTKINRKDFGLTWNGALEAGSVLVGDQVTITLDVQFVKD